MLSLSLERWRLNCSSWQIPRWCMGCSGDVSDPSRQLRWPISSSTRPLLTLFTGATDCSLHLSWVSKAQLPVHQISTLFPYELGLLIGFGGQYLCCFRDPQHLHWMSVAREQDCQNQMCCSYHSTLRCFFTCRWSFWCEKDLHRSRARSGSEFWTLSHRWAENILRIMQPLTAFFHLLFDLSVSPFGANCC